MSATLFALGIGIRAALVGLIAFAVLELLATQRLYATALVLTGIGALILADLVRCITRGDRLMERFVEGLAAGDFERPAPAGVGSGLRRLRAAIARAATNLNAARAARQLKIDYLQTLIDNVSVALLVVQPDGTLALANRAARKLAGRHANHLRQLSAVGEAAAAQLLKLKPGERQVVRLANGQRVLGSAARFSTAGARYQLLSLQNIQSELDAAELKAWQDLVRILAHEMMNSLTPIASLAESLKPLVSVPDNDAGNDVAGAIDAIARRSTGLMSFVERYRQMADLPAVQPRQIRLAELLGRIDRVMSATMADSGVSYASTVEPPELMLHADPDLLEQALINVIHNAAEAVAGTEAPRVEVRAIANGESIAIRVADNGPGLDDTQLDRIFVPFFTTKQGGSGIGLSLARQIALAHRGRLEVSANVPRGAVFVLTIPVGADLCSPGR